MQNVIIKKEKIPWLEILLHLKKYSFLTLVTGCLYGSELSRLGGLNDQDEMIFIPRSYGIFYLSSVKKFVMSLEKDFLIKSFLQ